MSATVTVTQLQSQLQLHSYHYSYRNSYTVVHGVQDYLCRRADKHMIPKVDNTNVDRSVATIHATVLACLRHTDQVLSLCAWQHMLCLVWAKASGLALCFGPSVRALPVKTCAVALKTL